MSVPAIKSPYHFVGSQLAGKRLLVLCFAVFFIQGLFLVFLLPPFGGIDEMFHWYRVLQLSAGEFLAEKLGPNQWGGPINLPCFAFAIDVWRVYGQPAEMLEAAIASAAANYPVVKATYTVSFPSTASFPPLAHIPQTLGVLVADLFRLDLLAQLWAGRLANLLFYFSLLTLIVVVAPFMAIPVAVVGFFPTAIHSAATLSADPVTLTLPMLLLAVVWRSRIDPLFLNGGSRPLFVILAALSLGTALVKPLYIFFNLVVAAVPVSRFGSAQRKWLFVISAWIVPGLVALLWALHHPFVPGAYWQTGADPQTILESILVDIPGSFVFLLTAIVNQSFPWWGGAYAVFGDLPEHTHLLANSYLWLGAAATIGIALTTSVKAGDRLVPVLSLAAGTSFCLALLLAFWVTYTQPGAAGIEGVQGRYFHAPMALIACAIVGITSVRDRVGRSFLVLVSALAWMWGAEKLWITEYWPIAVGCAALAGVFMIVGAMASWFRWSLSPTLLLAMTAATGLFLLLSLCGIDPNPFVSAIISDSVLLSMVTFLLLVSLIPVVALFREKDLRFIGTVLTILAFGLQFSILTVANVHFYRVTF